MTAPVLVFGYGNPSRGDDALGPEFARLVEESLGPWVARGELEVLTDYQLQVEHALDLAGRERVFFVDATADGEPWAFRPLSASRDDSYTSHALSPEALLHAYAQVVSAPAPPCFVIAIRGERFELGEPLSEGAASNLRGAVDAFIARWGDRELGRVSHL